ncbi:urea ABC transporter ATP-binding protein, partial [Paenibacillus darwinianus]
MGNSMLQTIGLTVQFGGFKAISDLDFSVNRGELRVILGPNGAGKTTLMDLITGKTKPTSGRIVYNGREIAGLEPFETAKLGIGRKFQNPHVFDNMTVSENIEVAFRGFHRVFKALFYKKSREIKERINDILITINLDHQSERMAASLSHG